jgi:ureidoacrylate peracid hydrolase
MEKARDRGISIVWTQSFIDPARAKPNYQARGFLQDARKRNIAPVLEGTEGSEWYSGMVKPLADEVVIRKYHYDAFSDTNLDLLLRSTGIKTILLTGFMANVCVETAARHGYIMGYYVVVVSDCTEAATRAEYESTLYNVGTYFGKTATSEEIFSLWEKG